MSWIARRPTHLLDESVTTVTAANIHTVLTLHASHSSTHFTSTDTFNMKKVLYFPHFAGEETETQRG